MSNSKNNSNLFKFNPSDLEEFALPKRQQQVNIFPKDGNKKDGKSTRRGHVESLKETVDLASSTPHSEFAFLPNALGHKTIKGPSATTVLLSSTSPAALPVGTAVAPTGVVVPPPAGGVSPTATTKKGGKAATAAANNDVDEVSVIMAGIQNADDAINFFARFGSETPVKFVHLIQDDSDVKTFSPYDLKVTNLPDPMVEHYTMSSAGIVHVCPGQPSECTPLSSWMRQGMMFKILRNIPFYKLYLHRKAFTIWKENIRFLLFTKQRRKLVDRMFYARKNSCSSIISAKKCLIDLQNVKLLNLDLKTCDKDIFFEQQTTQNTKANNKFDFAMNLMSAEVKTVMDEVNNMYSLSKSENHNNALGYSDSNLEKAKSLVKIKQEKAEKKVLRQRAKLEHSTLPEFIRFVDYIAIEFLVALAINTCIAFYDELIKPRKTGIFETMVRFSNLGTTFSPTCTDIREMLDKLLDSIINACGNVTRISYLNQSKSFAPGK
jgi:hypothetical protein